MLHYIYPRNGTSFSHDQAFKWCLSCCHNQGVVLTCQLCFMLPILGHLCNIFILAPIQSNHQRQVWTYGAWHLIHFRSSPRLSCPPIQHGECLQLSVKTQKESCFRNASGDIVKLIPFVCTFYVFEFPFILQPLKLQSWCHYVMIPSTMGIFQGSSSWIALFALTFFKALQYIANQFPSCLFPTIVDETCIS